MPVAYWCQDCAQWRVAENDLGVAICGYCGEHFVCGDCGFEIDMAGNCQRSAAGGGECMAPAQEARERSR